MLNFISWLIQHKRQLRDLSKGAAAISYSQQSEDLEVFRRFKGKKNGFYIDIGAFDPVIYSNTNLFYQNNWHGINIEPNPDSFERFKKLRKKDINLNIGISDENTELKCYKFDAPALNTFDKSHADNYSKTSEYNLTDMINVQTYPLLQILDKYLPENQQIDFMSVDCEGFDLKVLKSNDWKKYRPELLLVEESIVTIKVTLEESPVYLYLKDMGYNLATITSGTMIFKDLLNNNR